MQRNVQSHGELLKQVLLYRDDIEQIVMLLGEVSPDVDVSNNEHRFDNVNEWAELKREYFTNMQLSTRNPYISLALDKGYVHLFISEDTPQSRGVFEKIKHLLMERKRPRRWLLNIWMPTICINLVLILMTIALWRRDWTLLGMSGIFMGGCIWWCWLAIQSRFRYYSVIIPKYRIDAPNFWKRNSDKIVLAIIAASFGSLLTLLIKAFAAKGS